MNPGQRASAFDNRETLDEGVRRLSVNAGPIQERVRASSMVILDRLSPDGARRQAARSLGHAAYAAVKRLYKPASLR
jgi:hypothetical protein